MTDRKLGIGIIGCGAVAKTHLHGYDQMREACTLKAIADVNVQQVNEFAKHCPEEIDILTDVDQLLERPDIDIVSICTPPFLHKPQVLQALKHGKHVLCEKPFVPSLAECDELILAGKRSDRKLGVAMQLRFEEDFQKVDQLVHCIGPIYFAEMKGLYWRGDSYYNKPWRGRWEKECGGVLMTQGIHLLDLFITILGPVSRVSAEMATLKHSIEVEDHIRATIWFESGARGEVLCSLNAVDTETSMHFSGSNTAVRYPLGVKAVKENPGGFPVHDPEREQELLKRLKNWKATGQGHTAVIRDFIAAIKEDREPFVSSKEARKSLEVITAIYKSARLNEKVDLPITKDDPWYSGIQIRMKGAR